MKQIRFFVNLTILTMVILILPSCINYYKVAKISSKKSNVDSTIQANPERYFVLRTGMNAYHMNNIILSKDKKSVTCTLENLPTEHQLHLRNGRGGNMRYKKNLPEESVLSEIHIYTPQDNTAISGNSFTVSFDKITKLEIIDKDKGRTTASYILGGIGITGGFMAIAAVLIAALKSSCPFVSAYDGDVVSLQGEIYGGAIYPQLERNDYLPLKMAALPNGNLLVKISNELKERQYTDFAELLMVTHNRDVRVMVDENGRLYSVNKPVSPIAAKAADEDILPLISQQNDDRFYSFNDTLAAKVNSNFQNVQITFSKPAEAKTAKLILRMKNSYWMDFVFGKMIEGFGSYYASYIQQQHKKPVDDLKRWVKEQQLPLKVALLTSEGLIQAASITTFGPVANRETVIPLDLSSVNTDKVNINLSCGFMFWELDYAAIDYSNDLPFEVSVLPMVKAKDEMGKNVMPLLANVDGNYLQQPVPGNATDIEYKFTPTKDKSKVQDFVFHAKGYYEHVRDFKGQPDIVFLEKFRDPGALSTFSKVLYINTLNSDKQLIASDK